MGGGFKPKVSSSLNHHVKPCELSFQYRIRDHCLLIKCSIVLFIIIVMFFLSSFVDDLYVTVGWCFLDITITFDY